MSSMDMASIERATYRSRWDDGLVDIFVGVALIWIGAAWLWLEDFAALAGVLPAIAAGPFVAFRTRFLEYRAGYVRFSEERRRWERRNMIVLLALGAVVLAAGIGIYVMVTDDGSLSDVAETIAPGLVAVLAAIPVALVAAAARLLRAWGYAAVLVAGGVVAMARDLNPGVPLLVAGAVMALVGARLLVRFVRMHPTVGDGEPTTS